MSGSISYGFYQGLIDEVQIYNTGTTLNQVENLYNYGLIDGPTESPPISLSLLYPTNGTTYYGDYNGSIIAELSNVNGTATCSLNDSRWDLQDGPTFGNETVQFLNNTLITDRNISLFIQCNDSSDSANLSISFSSNLIPTMPTNISYNLNYNLDNPLVANASGSTDANNDTITYYYSFYNNNTLLQNWSTNSTYILNETDMFYELTIAAKAYDGTNYSDPYNITAELPDIDIYAFNTLTDAAISIYNITTEYRNYSNLSNGDIINLNYGTYNFTFIAFGYDDKTIEVTIIGDRNITGLLAQFYTFNIFREATATPFNTNETISTAVQYFCAEETVTYQFNVSANQNSAYFPVGCDWQFIKLDIIYATDSYYRAMMPAATEEVVNFYVLDLNNDLGVQVIFKLDDLIGDYTDGNLILLKAINGTNQVMHKQPFDAEQRVVSYLLKDGYYILKVEQADGTGVKTLGYIIAEAAAQKTITLPVFNWVPEVRVGDSISWSWENSTENTVRLIYSDTEKNTQSIKFTVYNGSNRSQALFTTTEIGVSDATFSYLGEENQSYYACFEAFEGYLGNLGEYCKEFTVFYKIPTPPGYTDSEWQILTAWICIIFLVVILLSLSGFPEVSLMMVAISMYIMKSMGLLNLTAPGLGILLDLLVVIIGVMAAFVWWKKHVVAK